MVKSWRGPATHPFPPAGPTDPDPAPLGRGRARGPGPGERCPGRRSRTEGPRCRTLSPGTGPRVVGGAPWSVGRLSCSPLFELLAPGRVDVEPVSVGRPSQMRGGQRPMGRVVEVDVTGGFWDPERPTLPRTTENPHKQRLMPPRLHAFNV